MAAWIRTERLLLRRWKETDLEPFAALNADADVMAHFPAVLSREESDALAARADALFDEHGFGLWAVEAPEGFVGFTGLSVPRFDAPFLASVEVGWRLARRAWGNGYATEAARAAVALGFEKHALREIVSFTAATNVRSQRVMERLGMMPDGSFDHPALPLGSPLRRHVLYRLPFSMRRFDKPSNPSG
jgi:RimJ/RimL family protein N-acetyltransferase